MAACHVVCWRVHGLEREHELRRALAQGGLTAVERGGERVGYAAGLDLLGHAVAETTDDLKALITEAPSRELVTARPQARPSGHWPAATEFCNTLLLHLRHRLEVVPGGDRCHLGWRPGVSLHHPFDRLLQNTARWPKKRYVKVAMSVASVR